MEGKIVRPSVTSFVPRLISISMDQCKRLCEAIGLEYLAGYEKRVVKRLTTDETVDRYGDIVRAKGAVLDNFLRNPNVLYSHESHNPPIGRSLQMRMNEGETGWFSDDLYLDDRVDTTGFSDLIFRYVASGSMPGGSIGFFPKTTRTDHGDEERLSLGLGKWGVEYLAWEYAEHSACTIPANPNALVESLKAIDPKKLRNFFDQEKIDRMEKLKILDLNLVDVFQRFVIEGAGEKTTPAPKKTLEEIITEGFAKINEGIATLASRPVVVTNVIDEDGDLKQLRDEFRETTNAIKKLSAPPEPDRSLYGASGLGKDGAVVSLKSMNPKL